MARYEHLPIYASPYRLALLIEQQVHGFSRAHKYAIRADLRELSRLLAARRHHALPGWL